MKNILNKVKF